MLAKMNGIIFENAKNGSLTCSADGKFLHSKYNPEKEAENYVNSMEIKDNASYILITEPCISYIAPEIKKKFKNSKLAAIRYTHAFDSFNSYFDSIIYVSGKNDAKNISSEIISRIGEKNILTSSFLRWIPASNAFKETDEAVWNSIKDAVNFSRASLFTNSYFSKRWFLNSIKNIVLTENFYHLNRTNLPVLIAASGRSLEDCLPKIKEERKKIYLMCVSSAASVLLKYKIIPDLVISTDGGFWAKKHLEALKNHTEIPLALAAEGACPSFLLKKNPVALLEYSDGFTKKMLDFSGIKLNDAQRNGTVSGTAVELALTLTEKNIYICGLDLHCSKGFQHTRPNRLELYNARNDTKISTCEIRSVKSELNTSALKIYEDWFSDKKRNFQGRVFRLSENFKFNNSLNSIKDVDFDFFCKIEKKAEKLKPEPAVKKINVEKMLLKNKIHKFSTENSKTEEWMDEFFSAEEFALKNKSNPDEKREFLEEIHKKNKKFIKKIENLLR